MARDFMGLNCKDPLVVVKEEVVETSIDSEFPKGAGAPWASSSKVSTLPHFLSFKTSQEEKLTELKTLNSPSLSHDAKILPYSAGNQYFKTLFAGGVQNFAGATMKQHVLGGVPVTDPHSVLPSNGFAAGTTRSQLNPKAFGAPAQMTIFYAGTVNVYDDISPEKAQAIMFLAGHGCNMSNLAKPAAEDGGFTNKFMNTPLGSALSSPMSITSHPITQTGAGSINNDEIKASKNVGVSTTIVSKVETPNIMSSAGLVPASTILSSAVPQARKASLARFLSMRKERVMNSSPYRLNKKSVENTNPESKYADFSPTSAGSNSMSTCKET